MESQRLFINMRLPPRDVTPLRSDIFTVPRSLSPKAKNWCSTPGGSIQIFARLDRASNDNVLIRNFPQSVRRDNKGRDAFYETLI